MLNKTLNKLNLTCVLKTRKDLSQILERIERLTTGYGFREIGDSRFFQLQSGDCGSKPQGNS